MGNMKEASTKMTELKAKFPGIENGDPNKKEEKKQEEEEID
jgi:hypothetical protein